LIQGSPGVGKTFFLRDLITKLRQAGRRVDVIAKTHCAVVNVGCGAVTADHWVRTHVRAGGSHCHVLVVEEVSMIDVQLWADIALIRMTGTQIICCGDFGQYQACAESWCGCPVAEGALENSHMLLEMCGANRFTLTENKRSDAKLFDFYTGLRCGKPDARDLQEALAEARVLFPSVGNLGPMDDDTKANCVQVGSTNYTLTMSHKRRVFVNRAQNQRLKPSEAIFIRAPAATRAGNQPQSMWVWPGLQLIGAGGKCLKGLFYTVETIMDDVLFLNTGQKLTRTECLKSLRLAYALTYASCQGLTLKGRVTLETESPNMTLRHLYVGISRATAANLVQVI
jgi:hypothetical protein